MWNTSYENHHFCVSWESRHIITFDKMIYTYPGTKTYTLVQDCSNDPQYRVYVNTTYSCTEDCSGGCQSAIKVIIYSLHHTCYQHLYEQLTVIYIVVRK